MGVTIKVGVLVILCSIQQYYEVLLLAGPYVDTDLSFVPIGCACV